MKEAATRAPIYPRPDRHQSDYPTGCESKETTRGLKRATEKNRHKEGHAGETSDAPRRVVNVPDRFRNVSRILPKFVSASLVEQRHDLGDIVRLKTGREPGTFVLLFRLYRYTSTWRSRSERKLSEKGSQMDVPLGNSVWALSEE
jgi:hypothetical protein